MGGFACKRPAWAKKDASRRVEEGGEREGKGDKGDLGHGQRRRPRARDALLKLASSPTSLCGGPIAVAHALRGFLVQILAAPTDDVTVEGGVLISLVPFRTSPHDVDRLCLWLSGHACLSPWCLGVPESAQVVISPFLLLAPPPPPAFCSFLHRVRDTTAQHVHRSPNPKTMGSELALRSRANSNQPKARWMGFGVLRELFLLPPLSSLLPAFTPIHAHTTHAHTH